MSADLVLAVLSAYPQVYHACHRRHPRRRTNPGRLSDRDGWILGHLHPTNPASPSRLAAHMGLRASTVSEAVKRLERLGYVTRRRRTGDGRHIELFLAAKGVEGLSHLAYAARTLNAREPKQWDDGEVS